MKMHHENLSIQPSTLNNRKRRRKDDASNVISNVIRVIPRNVYSKKYCMFTLLLLVATGMNFNNVASSILVAAFSSSTIPMQKISRVRNPSSSLSSTQRNDNGDMLQYETDTLPTSQTSTATLSMRHNILSSATRKRSRLSQGNSRLPVEEQHELFRHIMEVRRIRNIEIEIMENDHIQHFVTEPILKESMALPTTKISKLELARRTGYGNNVNELETALILGQQAREKLITTNMGLVHYCAKDILKHRTLRSITYDDLIQEGAIGLSRAVDKYNPSYTTSSSLDYKKDASAITTSSSNTSGSNNKFSTYAVYWIRAAILRSISERDDIMRVPEHVTTAIRKISSVAQTYGLSLEKADDDDYHTTATFASSNKVTSDMVQKIITDETGYSNQLIANAMKVRNRRNKYGSTVLSFESWMQQGKHYETDGMIQSSSEEAVGVPNIENMKNTLSRFLRPKEMEALSWRYGLNNHPVGSESYATSNNPLAKRNYIMEAEMELFGSGSTGAEGHTIGKKDPVKTDTTTVKGKWGEAMSFNEVGKQMQVSAEYGRRLCHGALEKLRRAVDDGKLEPALLF